MKLLNQILLLFTFVVVPSIALAQEKPADMDTVKAYSDLKALKERHTENIFKDPKGLTTSKDTIRSMANRYSNGDEAIIRFQVMKGTNINPSQFPLTEELKEQEEKAFKLIKEADAAVKTSERNKLNKMALEEVGKLNEMKKQLMDMPEGTTFTSTIKLGNFDTADRAMRQTLINFQAKGLRIVSVDRLPAEQVRVKNSLLRTISKGGKGLGGLAATGALLMTSALEASAATKASSTGFRLSSQKYQGGGSSGAQ